MKDTHMKKIEIRKKRAYPYTGSHIAGSRIGGSKRSTKRPGLRSLSILALCSMLALCAIAMNMGCAQKDDGKIHIGITQIIKHPALDAAEQGFMEVLEASDLDIVFDRQNANGDITLAGSIADRFSRNKVDLAYAISTPSAQSLVHVLKKTPIVFAAVSDPVEAGLFDSWDARSPYLTG